MKAPNISFREYHELADTSGFDKHIKLLKLQKPKDVLNIGEFVDLSFGFVKDMQEHFNHSGITWGDFLDEMSGLSKKSIEDLASMSVYDINLQFLYCQDQVKIINNIEQKKLSHKPDADETAANIARFGAYRGFLQLDKLAGGDMLKLNKIRELPYHLCLTKLALDADNVRFTKDLQNIKDRKNKTP